MNMKAAIKKEILDGFRNYRFFIIGAGFLFFAILTPLMLKYVMPGIMRSQFPELSEEAVAAMINMTQTEGLRKFFADIFQLGMLVMVFVLSGLLAQELSERTLILPVMTGKGYGELLLSKMLVYGSALIALSIISTLVSYLYNGALFSFSMSSLLPVIRSGLLLGIYMVFVLSMLLLAGSFVAKPAIAGMVVLIPAWFMPQLGGLLKINRYLPSGLMDEVQALAVIPSSDLLLTIACTAAFIILIIGFTILRLGRLELTKG